jgi:hypothetical protein
MAQLLGGCAEKLAVRSALGAGGVSPPMFFTSFAKALAARNLSPGCATRSRLFDCHALQG